MYVGLATLACTQNVPSSLSKCGETKEGTISAARSNAFGEKEESTAVLLSCLGTCVAQAYSPLKKKTTSIPSCRPPTYPQEFHNSSLCPSISASITWSDFLKEDD